MDEKYSTLHCVVSAIWFCISVPLYVHSNYCIHGPKSDQNFRDITWNLVENITLYEIFRVVSRFPPYILCCIAENRFSLVQCTVNCVLHCKYSVICLYLYRKIQCRCCSQFCIFLQQFVCTGCRRVKLES